MRAADWIVDVGPGAGEKGGQHSLQRAAGGLKQVEDSQTRALSVCREGPSGKRAPHRAEAMAEAARHHPEQSREAGCRCPGRRADRGHRHFRLGQVEPGQPGHGRAGGGEARACARGRGRRRSAGARGRDPDRGPDRRRSGADQAAGGASTRSRSGARRAPTSRPIPACSTMCASSSPRPSRPKARRYDAGRFSFNVAKGRCDNCEGEGWVMVELLFLPSVYAPCPVCRGTRYNPADAGDQVQGQEHRRGAGHARR